MGTEEKSTLEKILDAARKEFLEKGFKDATLRGIAAKASVTTGALYRYYSSKEDLFGALVSSTYYGMIDIYNGILTDFQALPGDEQYTSMEDHTKVAAKRMIDFVYENKDAMKLILCSSEGTEWMNLVEEMSRLDTEATHSFTAESNEAGYENIHLVNPMLEHMLTRGMFSMAFEIIVHDVERKEADELISTLLEFFSAGWKRIMGF